MWSSGGRSSCEPTRTSVGTCVCSMPLDDEVRVRHLVGSGEQGMSYAADRSRADLDDDELLRLALTNLVEIVSEAAKHISDDLRESRPEVPWSAASRMRDRLIHHYFDINLDVLWSTVTDELPRLLALLPDDLTADRSAPTASDRAASTSSSRTALQTIPRPGPTSGDKVRSDNIRQSSSQPLAASDVANRGPQAPGRPGEATLLRHDQSSAGSGTAPKSSLKGPESRSTSSGSA